MKVLIALLFFAASISVGSVRAEDAAIFEAAKVARTDLAKRLVGEKKSEWKYADYIANIDNYNVGISETRNAYVVVFLVRQPPRESIRGGGGEYRVQKKTMKILSFFGYE